MYSLTQGVTNLTSVKYFWDTLYRLNSWFRKNRIDFQVFGLWDFVDLRDVQ